MNSQQIVAQLNNKVEECLQDVQQQLDSSFRRIEAFIDQFALPPYQSDPNKNVDFARPPVEIQPLKQTLANQITQGIKPITHLAIPQQNKQNQVQLTQLQSKQIQVQQDELKDSITNNGDQLNLKPLPYILLQSSLIQQSESCYAIAINKDNQIVVAGSCNKIKVFEFKQEQLKQTQLLSVHQRHITTLNFMKKQDQFISGDQGGLIIKWFMNENSQWIQQQKLNEHSKCINCLVINNNEDLLISGSDDCTIKFWKKQNEWICSQSITDHTNYVLGLSLNDQQNRVITCGQDNVILIIELSPQDEKWNIIQMISVEKCGYRLCIIDDKIFTFQPDNKRQMDVYETSSNNKWYSKKKQIAVKSGESCNYYFPQQYLKQKCLLVNKNGYNINLLRKDQNDDFITLQSIDFGDNYIFGQMSEDGKYLITWDGKSNQFQIRKYNYK
ncbi:unnamed protein product (macronuclear) [Paramecium tetraurelia]|uniref:Uncharacterized protein n=1 Tax=Paramecium tetraurelia TaxID=5888 RepID=A0EE45_PARTE|nr:uncharacterized protein GSPATT00025906001 [Paramecium tetraurelia]CAK93562.1 unnamed protein product [Paramecium tetraurelia]|eukprot:XP_001460959.1 hypothetical protein (macronuclear) [Paramecium tetraurelia strain d4-2]